MGRSMGSPVKKLEQLALEVNGFRFEALACGPADAELVLFLHGFTGFADA